MGIEVFPSIGIGIEVCQIRGIGIGIGIAQMSFWVLVLVLRLKIMVLSVSARLHTMGRTMGSLNNQGLSCSHLWPNKLCQNRIVGLTVYSKRGAAALIGLTALQMGLVKLWW